MADITLGNYDKWHCRGRGRCTQFFATPDEIQNWLLEDLPASGRPYRLLVNRSIRLDRRNYVWQSSCHELHDYKKVLLLDPVIVHIWSKMLRPNLEIKADQTTDVFGRLWNSSGLIDVHPGSRSKCGEASSSIGMVPLAESDDGEIVDNRDYEAIYNSFVRRIRKKLIYASILLFPDGSEFETNREPMTQGAVEAWRNGYPFRCRPGRPLKH